MSAPIIVTRSAHRPGRAPSRPALAAPLESQQKVRSRMIAATAATLAALAALAALAFQL